MFLVLVFLVSVLLVFIDVSRFFLVPVSLCSRCDASVVSVFLVSALLVSMFQCFSFLVSRFDMALVSMLFSFRCFLSRCFLFRYYSCFDITDVSMLFWFRCFLFQWLCVVVCNILGRGVQDVRCYRPSDLL
jgi:hypothetical protein